MDTGPLWTRPWPAALAAAILAMVLAGAAVAKLRDRAATADGLTQLGIDRRVAGLIVPVEALTALCLIVASVVGGLLAFAVLAGFTLFLVDVLRRGTSAPCRCFGGTSDKPVGPGHIIRNGVLLALALVAGLWP